MTVHYRNPPELARPIGPFSHVAVSTTGVVAIAGQVAVDGQGELVGVDDFGAQVEQVLANIASALGAVGLAP